MPTLHIHTMSSASEITNLDFLFARHPSRVNAKRGGSFRTSRLYRYLYGRLPRMTSGLPKISGPKFFPFALDRCGEPQRLPNVRSIEVVALLIDV